MASYTMNTEAAKQADNFGNYIDATGKYKGHFVLAEAVVSKNKSQGIEFTFKSEDGREANYLTLWTHKEDGTELMGYKVLCSILVILRAKNVDSESRTIEKYDSASRQKVKTLADVFPALMNKPIGVLLQRESYEKTAGGIGHKLNIVAAFESSTELMSSELLAKKTTPEQLGKVVARLADKPMKQAAPAHQAATDFYAEYDRATPADDINW